MTPDRPNPWTRSTAVLTVCTAGGVLLDRVFRPYDPLQNAILVAFLAGTLVALTVVRPLSYLPYMVRNLEAGPELDVFLVCAVASWLAVRFALGVSGNPRVQGGGLHIAHMLWGGALMVAGIIILLLYLGRYRQRLAAVVAGLGFGLFIDELGKFITSNNDYFYRPAVALVYAIFVALYLLFRTLGQPHHVSDRENLVNALDWLKEAVIRDHDPRALDRARYHVQRTTAGSADRALVEDLLQRVLTRPLPVPSRHEQVRRVAANLYYRVIRSAWYERAAIGLVLLLLVVQFVTDLQEIRSLMGAGSSYRLPGTHELLTYSTSIGIIIEGVASVVGDGLLLVGAILLVRSRVRAFTLWRLGIQIITFIAGVMSLYYFQFLALPELTVDIVALAVVTSLIEAERRCTVTELHLVHRATPTLEGPGGHSVSTG